MCLWNESFKMFERFAVPVAGHNFHVAHQDCQSLLGHSSTLSVSASSRELFLVMMPCIDELELLVP